MTRFCACKLEKHNICDLGQLFGSMKCGLVPWLGTASCHYLQLLGKDGILPDGVDPQPLIRIFIRRLPSLDVPQHPPVHVVAPHLPWAGRGKNLIKKK